MGAHPRRLFVGDAGDAGGDQDRTPSRRVHRNHLAGSEHSALSVAPAEDVPAVRQSAHELHPGAELRESPTTGDNGRNLELLLLDTVAELAEQGGAPASGAVVQRVRARGGKYR